MKYFLTYPCWIILLVGCHHLAFGQQSTNTVNYQLTYNVTTGRYTAWVIPNYNTPNAINGATTEKGGTAQFTIKVPASFSITSVQDINGTWEKNPSRLGPGNAPQVYTTPLDPTYNYFVVGKSPSEVDYGAFAVGTPVPLFSFAGNGCFGELIPLPPGDPFIAAADNDQSLNVANSFYSRSGTPPGGNQTPLEQFVAITGPAAQCAVLQANADSQTLTAGQSTTVTQLANDTRNGQPVSATDVTVSISTAPTTGTATVNADGTIKYSPAPGFSGPVSFTYTICAPTQTTICSSAPVNLTVNALVMANPGCGYYALGHGRDGQRSGQRHAQRPACQYHQCHRELVSQPRPRARPCQCQWQHQLHPGGGFLGGQLVELHHLRYGPAGPLFDHYALDQRGQYGGG